MKKINLTLSGKSIGKRIKEIRKENNLTLDDYINNNRKQMI